MGAYFREANAPGTRNAIAELLDPHRERLNDCPAALPVQALEEEARKELQMLLGFSPDHPTAIEQ